VALLGTASGCGRDPGLSVEPVAPDQTVPGTEGVAPGKADSTSEVGHRREDLPQLSAG